MVPQILSRTQRRIERRQALLLLALVLGVSLVSFALGVMVGRGKGQTAIQAASAVERLPVAVPGTPGATPPMGTSAENLTFYDSLPKGGKPPLGSGINLPPSEKPAPAPAAQPAPAQSVQTQTSSTAAADPALPAAQPKTAQSPGTLPAAQSPAGQSPTAAAKVAPGGWAIQVGSFRGIEDARNLQQRLEGKGYAAFVQEANLAEKGTWYRVMVGPFESEGSAAGTAGLLRDKEKMSILVRRL